MRDRSRSKRLSGNSWRKGASARMASRRCVRFSDPGRRTASRARMRERVVDCGEGFLAESAFEYVCLVSVRGELFTDGVDVAGSLGEHEACPAGVECLGDV